MGLIKAEDILFSQAIKEDWHDKDLWDKVLRGEMFINPDTV
jgi:hypothetical protein